MPIGLYGKCARSRIRIQVRPAQVPWVIEGGMSFPGVSDKKPLGFSMNPVYAAGMTG
jgi:hypothetical protein